VLAPTACPRRKAGASYAAVATVFVHKTGLGAGGGRQGFCLTPAELRVLFAIAEVGGVPDVADELGLSEGTVQTRLQNPFEKTARPARPTW
jgi:DNA-binding NarL/FixJ family response regulator